MRRARHYTEATAKARAALQDAGNGADRVGAHHLLGMIHDDFGRYTEAAAAYEAASRDTPDAAYALRYRALALERLFRSLVPDQTAERQAVRDELDTLIETDGMAPETVAHLLWARGRVRGGAYVDDRVTSEDLRLAREDIDRALTLAPDLDKLHITKARHARLAAASGVNREQELKLARDALDAARHAVLDGRPPDSEMEARFLLEEARLEIIGRDWSAAMPLLEAAIKRGSPPPQAARVWQVYCRRLSGQDYAELEDDINALLVGPEGPEEAPVINAGLRAQLRVELAALVEPRDPYTALRLYERALATRPTYSFARRGRLRCLQARGRTEDADDLLGQLLEEDERTPLEPDALVEISNYLNIRKGAKVVPLDDQAMVYLDRAIAAPLHYSYAVERKVALLRGAGEFSKAIVLARNALQDKTEAHWGNGGLRVELGNCYLAAGRANSAIAQFEHAERDPSIGVRNRARAGRVNALLWKRDLPSALALVTPEECDGWPRLLDAAGWACGVSGYYKQALEHFAEARRLRPFESSPVIGQARVLRLLGRPAQAGRDLGRLLSTWPKAEAHLLLNEMGWAALDERRNKDAVELFEKVLVDRPWFQASVRGRVLAISGVETSHRHVDAAIEEALKATRGTSRGEAATLTEAGLAMLQRRDFHAARRFFARANGLSTSVSQRILQGHALLQAGRVVEAGSCADEARELAEQASVVLTDAPEILDELDYISREPGPDRSAYLRVLVGELRTEGGAPDVAQRIASSWYACERGEISNEELTQRIGRERRAAVKRQREEVAGVARATDLDVLLLRGACLLARGERAEALEAFRSAARAPAPESVPATLAKCLALSHAQDYNAALGLLDQVTADPATSSMRASELRAWCLLRIEQATPRAERLPATARSIEEACRAAIEAEPGRVDSYLCLATLAAHRGSLPEALAVVDEAVKVTAGSSHALRERAALLLHLGDIDGALAGVGRVLALDAGDSRAHLIAGLAHLERGDLRMAIEALRRAHRLDPASVDALLGLVVALGRHQAHDEAVTVLDAAIPGYHANGSAAHLARARALFAMSRELPSPSREHRLSRALQNADRGLRLAGTKQEKAEAHYHRGVVLLEMGSTDRALRALTTALDQEPEHDGARDARAVARAALGDIVDRRLPRHAAYAIGILAVVLLVTVMGGSAAELATNGFDDKFPWTAITFAIFGLLIAIAVAGLLPRIAGVKLREVEITIAAPPPPSSEPASPKIDFGRLPAATLSGPSTFRISEVSPDLSDLTATV